MLRSTALACATAALIGAAAPAALAQAKPTPLKAGDKAPDFTLKSWDGKKSYTLSDYRAKGDKPGSIVVVDFWCGVQFIAIDSNKLFKGKKLADYIASAKLPFPIVEDDNFTIADKFGALVTPHVFVVDRQGVIRFAGGMDNRRKPGAADYQPYLRHALDALLAGKAPSVTKARAYG
ncbi:MAG: redoxin domain-containing protein [Planctomycetota bacterium]|jgi:peroxiredoxin